MKSFAILFCVFALGGLGETQSTCSLDSATSSDIFSGNSDTAGDSSSGDIAGDGRSSDFTGGGSSSDFTGGGSSSDILDQNDALNTAQDNSDNVVFDSAQIAKDLIKARSLQSRPLLNKRADFICSSDETCVSIDHEVFCGNEETGDIRDPYGSTGNIITGEYTLADGEEGNLRTGPFPGADAALEATTAPASTRANRSSHTTTIKNNASPTSDAAPLTSATSAILLQTKSSSSTPKAPAPSESGPGNGASTLGSASGTLTMAGVSLIAGSLLFLF